MLTTQEYMLGLPSSWTGFHPQLLLAGALAQENEQLGKSDLDLLMNTEYVNR
jgi:hypothetical protein